MKKIILFPFLFLYKFFLYPYIEREKYFKELVDSVHENEIKNILINIKNENSSQSIRR